jgi:LacI family transcriptional regulator
MVTLKDIADEAGVSVMTVSRVVNKRLHKVSKENMEKIQSIIDRTGYVPNLTARGLSNKSPMLIAIILRTDERNALANPYNATMLAYLCRNIRNAGYATLVHADVDFHDIFSTIGNWHAAGVIIFGLFDHEIKLLMSATANFRFPLIFFDSYSDIRQINNIGIDDYKGGYIAARYLIDRGHKQLGIFRYDTGAGGVEAERYKGFKDAITEAGLTLNPAYEYCAELAYSNESEAQARKAWARDHFQSGDRPTAIFFMADRLAAYFINIMHDIGISVPDDISVIGFDNIDIADLIIPHLTTVAQDMERKAAAATDVLFRHIQNPGEPTSKIVIDVEIIERESVKAI